MTAAEEKRTIKEIIDAITYTSAENKFPETEIKYISAHMEEARPYLYEAMEYAAEENEKLPRNYMLHIYSAFLCAELRDREAFERIVNMTVFPSDTTEAMFGDIITEDLRDLLYATYNGDWKLMCEVIRRADIDPFVQSGMLDVLAQLYLDGSIEEDGWKAFLKEIAGTDGLDPYVYTSAAGVITELHFYELLPEIKRLFQEDRIDETVYGTYSEHIDGLFLYEEGEPQFCRKSVDTCDRLGNWLGGSVSSDISKEERKKFEEDLEKMLNAQKSKAVAKVGRNDPCPCGSGKKYKKCCMNREQEGQYWIESGQNQMKALRDYPKTGLEHVEGRIYLEDYYDSESIEIDRLVYLALNRSRRSWWESPNDRQAANERELNYLKEAFPLFTAKFHKEEFTDCGAYDETCAIHYPCGVWLTRLGSLIAEKEEYNLQKEVLDFLDAYQR